jgi:hypothetical protein
MGVVWGKFAYLRGRCGGGNVGIGFIVFRPSINRYFHGLILSSPTFQAAIFVIASAQSSSNCIGLRACLRFLYLLFGGHQGIYLQMLVMNGNPGE